jgi:hypothetical protein
MMLSACLTLAAECESDGGIGAQLNVNMLLMKVMEFERTESWPAIEL